MRLNFIAHRRQAGNVRRVGHAIVANLDAEVTLEDLAASTNLSPAHMVRIYSRCVGEPPMQTLRRLRLQRAFAHIGQSTYGQVTEIGFAAGYGSSAAFSHAFRKQFGIAPSDVPSIIQPPKVAAPIRLEYVPERQVWQFAYSGAYAQNGWYKAHIVWQCHAAGRGDLLAWRVNDRDHPFSEQDSRRVQLTHFVPVNDLSAPLDAELATHPAGLYAVIEAIPSQRASLLTELALRVRQEFGCQIIDGPTLDRDIHERCFRVPQERRVQVYVPVAPISTYGQHLRKIAEAAARRKF